MRARTLVRPALLLAIWTILAGPMPRVSAVIVPTIHDAVLLALSDQVAKPHPAIRGGTGWRARIKDIVRGKPISVVIGNDGEAWYRNKAGVRRPPASNQKLMLSMALLNRFELDRTIRTRAMSRNQPVDGVLHGDLWIVGAGDPETGTSQMSSLADQLLSSGLTKIRGHVIGATSPFVRDWWARGWRDYFPAVFVQIPTALTFRGNVAPTGWHVRDPERRAAQDLTQRLKRRGVEVTKKARMAGAPSGLTTLAEVRSAPLRGIMRRMNISSSNLRAEVLGKYLGRYRFGQPSIDGGARAIRAFVRAQGFGVRTYDSSGLSYANRVTVDTLVRLLWYADGQPWAEPFRNTLPTGGQGTLAGRLEKIQLHAKTGTLIDVSALSGWVWLERSGQWGEFSILSRGIDASRAKHLENRIVRIVANDADDPTP
jgi:D-alanyl-D-alanine carboxypeptidase/D-alanyl-D-alanine-endopeptidase (penicillin-binding protein 4)